MPPDATALDETRARLARFVAAHNRGAQHCLHLDGDEAVVRTELEELETPPEIAWHLAEADGELLGVALVDVDEELGRAWLYGPWTRDDDEALAARLLDAALAAVPPAVRQVDNFLGPANAVGLALHEARGFHVERRSSVLRCTAPPPGDGAGEEELSSARRAALGALHLAAFPGTWLTPERLWEQAAGPDLTLLHLPDPADPAGVLGYLVLEFDRGAREATVQYVAVAPEARGRGLGRALLLRALRRAFADPDVEAVTLVVDDANERAFGLYTSVGFVLLHEGLVIRRGSAS